MESFELVREIEKGVFEFRGIESQTFGFRSPMPYH